MESDGFQDFMDRGLAITHRIVAEASKMQRKPFPLSYLTIGVRCVRATANPSSYIPLARYCRATVMMYCA